MRGSSRTVLCAYKGSCDARLIVHDLLDEQGGIEDLVQGVSHPMPAENDDTSFPEP